MAISGLPQLGAESLNECVGRSGVFLEGWEFGVLRKGFNKLAACSFSWGPVVLAGLIDVAQFLVNSYLGDALHEGSGFLELWLNDHLPVLVDVSPFPALLYGCQTFGEAARDFVAG